MGRKIDMKKIENITKCQVTFSKRRSSLMKKANEIAVCCDADVAFVAFSPSGRISKFSNQKRIEDVLHRYVDLPANKRLNHISNVEGKMEKLKQLSHINGDNSKLQFLDKQIENLELQIKKSGLELQILETDLRDYELGPEQEPSLHLLSWCERNLNQSLQRIMTRKGFLQMEKMEWLSQNQAPYPSTFSEIGEAASAPTNPFTGQILMQLDPWISPYNARVRDSLLQDLFDHQGEHTTNGNLGPLNTPNFQATSNFPIQESPTIFGSEIMTSTIPIPPPHFPSEQSFTVDQPLLNFHDQMNVNAWDNTSHVVFSDATHMSTPNLYSTQVPSSACIPTMTLPNPSRLEMPQSLFDEIGTGLQYANRGQFSNIEGQEIGGQLNMDHNGGFINGNPRNGNEELGDYCLINREIQKSDQLQDSYIAQPPNEVNNNNAPCGSFFSKDANADSGVWTTNAQRAGLWEWEDILDENFNFHHVSQV